MLHGRTKEIIPCPYKWTPDWTPNSEFILLWAIEEALRLDREMSNEMLAHFQSEEFGQDDSIPEEEKQELMHAWSQISKDSQEYSTQVREKMSRISEG